MHISHNNQIEPLIDFDRDSVQITKTLNGNFSLSFFIPKTDRNNFCYSMIREDAVVTVDGENFVIVDYDDAPDGKTVAALHEFFDLNYEHVDATLEDAFHTIGGALSVVFNNTDWTYRVHDVFAAAYLKSVGDDNPIALLNAIVKAFDAEYTVSSKDKIVHVRKRIGRETEYQVRYAHNLITLQQKIDTTDVKTAIRIRYNKRDDGTYASVATYISPHASRYRKIRWAATVEYDTTDEADALAYGASQLITSPTISITCEFAHLQVAGYNADDIDIGNSLYLVDPRLNISEYARITSIKYFPYSSQTPVVELANRVRNVSDTLVHQQQQHSQLQNEAVKKEENNGGVIITEDGLNAIAKKEKKVEIRINATEGFIIVNGEIKKFYVDTDGNVTFDGRLLITKGDGATPMLEAFLDELGGRLLMYDVDGNLNLKMGSEETSESNRGGILKLYDDGEDRLRVALGATAEYGGNGSLKLYDSTNVGRIFMAALNDPIIGGLIGIADETGSVKTSLTLNRGQIGGENIATEAYANAIGDDILGEVIEYVDGQLSSINQSITSLSGRIAALEAALAAQPSEPTE